MTHKEALTHPHSDPPPECDGELIDSNRSFSSDVYWTVFTCSECFAVVFTVEGSRHWWNHEGSGSPQRMARIAEMVAARNNNEGNSMRHEPQGLERYANTDPSLHFNTPEPLNMRWRGAWMWCLRHSDYESAQLIHDRNIPPSAKR